MNKEKFISDVNKRLDNISLNDSKEIIINIIDKLPSDLYQKVLCIIDDKIGNLNSSLSKKVDIQEIKDKFELIENLSLLF